MKSIMKAKNSKVSILTIGLTLFITTILWADDVNYDQVVKLDDYKTQLMEDVKKRLKAQMGIAVNAVNQYYSKNASDTDLQHAMSSVRALKYGENGYFWINDYSGKMLMHPIASQLEGETLWDFKDPSGLYLFREFVNVSKNQGGGFVRYSWPKPGFADPQPKLSFVMAFDDWKWVVGTGVYIDDIDRALEKEKKRLKLKKGQVKKPKGFFTRVGSFLFD